jgi:hypothetical protein
MLETITFPEKSAERVTGIEPAWPAWKAGHSSDWRATQEEVLKTPSIASSMGGRCSQN